MEWWMRLRRRRTNAILRRRHKYCCQKMTFKRMNLISHTSSWILSDLTLPMKPYEIGDCYSDCERAFPAKFWAKLVGNAGLELKFDFSHIILDSIWSDTFYETEADLDLTPYKGWPSIKQMNHVAWLELIQCVLYSIKHISAAIYNRSTRDHHKDVSGSSVF